ncbi:Uncharacterized membrane protein [Pseudomonas asturiensis]|uniref:Uncharacterized membrane protein n=1 Tax=Pseudomonas asturiensis TaxID=1190415 RepID=A0A1M7PP90_9PSED|nr:DUF2142 domain-containing protein [Pseudomonas asturiensis]SHN19132.1 Uncharacterized membrane protein [Pseudomonas asturiensis]
MDHEYRTANDDQTVNQLQEYLTQSRALARRHITFFLYAFLAVVVHGVSMLVPPMQSPDEIDHLQRAYLLAHGQIFLQTPAGASSGGQVDTGLVGYLVNYATLAGKPDARLTADLKRHGEAAQWTGVHGFSSLPGTGYNLPAIYAPQALALAIGEQLNLSIDASYRMARLFVLITTLSLLIAAFKLYRPSPLALIVLVLPMSLFQMTASTIDGMSMALAFFAVSCFKRDWEQENTDRRVFMMLTVSVAVLVTCRAYMAPMLLMLIAPAILHRSRQRLIIAVAATGAVVAWTVLGMAVTTDLRSGHKVTPGAIAKYYLTDPAALWNVMYATLSDAGLTAQYWRSFIGTLGWLDTTMPMSVYIGISTLIALALLINVRLSAFKPRSAWVLLLCGFASMVLVFLAMLVIWTPHPAQVIDGIQGRYFALPVIVILCALDSKSGGSRWLATYGIVFMVFLVSTFSMITTLADRYYLSNTGTVAQ